MRNTFIAIFGLVVAGLGLVVYLIAYFGAKADQKKKKPVPGSIEYAREYNPKNKGVKLEPINELTDKVDELENENNSDKQTGT